MFNPSKAKPSKLGHLFGEVKKYNQNHDARGRFAPSTGGAVGPAGGVISLEDALAGKPLQAQPEPYKIEVTESKAITLIDNQLGIPEEEALQITGTIDDLAAEANTKTLKTVSFKELDPQVLAQCEGGWQIKDNKILTEATIAVNPAAREYATSRYVQDHMALVATGKMPWLASAHADDADKAYKAVMLHEVAHAKMMEHTLNSKSKPFDRKNPMQGTVTWSNVINKAHAEGWQGPSMYGRKNTGECFAECASLLSLKGTTGSESVDRYVKAVMTE
jgi:hypothetical protein